MGVTLRILAMQKQKRSGLSARKGLYFIAKSKILVVIFSVRLSLKSPI